MCHSWTSCYSLDIKVIPYPQYCQTRELSHRVFIDQSPGGMHLGVLKAVKEAPVGQNTKNGLMDVLPESLVSFLQSTLNT